MLVLLLACSRPTSAPPPAPEPVGDPLQRAAAFNATRPRYERPLVEGRPRVEGISDLSAKSCGACHPDMLAEWERSIHAQAWVDPQYQAEIRKSGNRWLCLNCHTPLQVQQDRLAVGLEDGDVERPILVENPAFDEALREEGITCVACHLRGDRIVGPGLGGNAPHPVEVDPDFRSGALCERCHQANATYPGKSFICVFDTGEEWRAGPWHEEGVTCVDCHMPAAERPLVPGAEPKRVGQHWWRGAGIPKIEGRYPPPEANRFGLELHAEPIGDGLQIRATNAHAGHLLPTGDPERKTIIELRFTDEEGEEISRKSWFFGQVWTWNPPTRHADTRLGPRETQVFEVPVPKGATRATVRAINERMSEQNRAYHHLDGYPIRVETHRIELHVGR